MDMRTATRVEASHDRLTRVPTTLVSLGVVDPVEPAVADDAEVTGLPRDRVERGVGRDGACLRGRLRELDASVSQRVLDNDHMSLGRELPLAVHPG